MINIQEEEVFMQVPSNELWLREDSPMQDLEFVLTFHLPEQFVQCCQNLCEISDHFYWPGENIRGEKGKRQPIWDATQILHRLQCLVLFTFQNCKLFSFF